MTDRAPMRAGAAPRPGARGSWSTPLISVVLLVGSLGSAHNAPQGVLPVLLLAGLAVTCLPLAWSRPRVALPLAGAAVATFFALGLPNGPLFVVLPGVAFIAARQVPWSQLGPLIGLPLLMLFVGLTLRVLLHDGAGFVTVWQAIGVTALTLGASLAGARLTERQELRAEQAKRSATEEQLRMAQGLHDGVGHGLAVIAMHAQVALHVLDKTSIPGETEARLRQSLDAIRSSSQDSLTALRRELAVMSSGAAARAPAPGVGDLRPLLERVRSGGLVVELPSDLPLTSEVPDEVGQVVYAVVQESLTNVLRHAQAQRAIVTFRNSGGRLTVTIADDGVGRPNLSNSPSGLISTGPEGPVPAFGRGGLGITGLRNRVEDLGGHLETPAVPRGFVVSATIPVAP